MTLSQNTSNLPEKNTSITLIASGKGGVGKTWFTVSLAQALSQQGKKVLVFDGDLGMANIDIQLGITPPYDLTGFLGGEKSLEQIVYPYEAGGFDLIAGRSGCGSLASLGSDQLTYLKVKLQELKTSYDIILVDLGAGIGGIVKSFLDVATNCCVVLTDEPTSLTDGYAFIKITHTTYPELPLSILVNQAENQTQGLQTYESFSKVCQTFLKLTPGLQGVVQRDEAIKKSIRAQTSLLTRYPTSQAAQDVQRIASASNKWR